MIHMEKRHLYILQNILSKYPYHFYTFGSRVKGTERQFSDLDLCFKEDIPSSVLSKLDEEFEESDLPFKVDIVDWRLCSSEFQEVVKNDLILLDFSKDTTSNFDPD